MSRGSTFTTPLVRLIALQLLSAVLTLSLVSCAARPKGSAYEGVSEAARDPVEADRLSRLAATVADRDVIEAERLLRQALSNDLFCGPAHHNLGTLLLARGELYEAANEFEWAAKLMPGHPDPRLNLGLALERAGRTDESLNAYRTALDVRPGHVQSMQAMASLQIRSGRTQPETSQMLREIALRGDSAHWRDWAREWEIKLRSQPTDNQ